MSSFLSLFCVGKPFSRNLGRLARLRVEALEERLVPTLLGQQLFPADNPWNQVITNAPVASNSDAVLKNITDNYGAGQLHPDFGQDYQTSSPLYGIPYNVVHGNTATKVNVVIDAYPGESDVQALPLPSNVVIEGDYQNGPNVGVDNRGDSHMLVYDVDNNVAYEFYHASRPSENSDGKWHAAQETVWDMKSNTFRTLGYTSADAAGLSILAGLVRPDEALPVSDGGQGVINHAIRVTLDSSLILQQYLYPASHAANPGHTDTAVQVPMGARFRLKADVDISQLSPESKIIAQAMKDYGLIVADNGSNFYFSGASYSVDGSNSIALTYDDNDIQDDNNGLKSLNFNDFELVDLTPSVSDLSVHTGDVGTTVTITGQNFSGAAGNLQVLFGTTPATSVNVVDDSHVTAVAPAGTGTVDVRVQSGLTVPADNQNVESTIFGYGISPVTANDSFTYPTSTPPPGGDPTDPPAGGDGSAGTPAGGDGSTSTPPVSDPVNPPTVGDGSTGALPVIDPIAPQSVADSKLLAFAVSATAQAADGSAATVIYSLGADAPAGASIDPLSGLFTWTPSQLRGQAPGDYPVTIMAAASITPNQTSSTTVTITVGPTTNVEGSGQTAREMVADGLTQSAEYYTNLVTPIYLKYLGRGPDAAGLNYWVNLLQQGLTDEQLEAGFIGSDEYIKNHGGSGPGWIQGMYGSLLGRAPSAGEVQYWVNNLNNGMAPSQIALGFAASPERESQRVAGDYQQYLGRGAQPAEIQFWVNVFVNGGRNEQVIAGFLSSQEYFQNHGNNIVDWLYADYRATLQRNPDSSGFIYWLGQLL